MSIKNNIITSFKQRRICETKDCTMILLLDNHYIIHEYDASNIEGAKNFKAWYFLPILSTNMYTYKYYCEKCTIMNKFLRM